MTINDKEFFLNIYYFGVKLTTELQITVVYGDVSCLLHVAPWTLQVSIWVPAVIFR